MSKISKNKTVVELQDEYLQKEQQERRARERQKYRALSNLFSQIEQRNKYGKALVPVSPKKLNQWQKFCKVLLDLLLKRKKK